MTLRCCIRQHTDENEAVQSQASCYLRGLAIATCCHHLCQWKSYISNHRNYCYFCSVNNVNIGKFSYKFPPAGKKYISDMGFTKEDFHAISWFTSWAVDADHGSDFPVVDLSAQLEIM